MRRLCRDVRGPGPATRRLCSCGECERVRKKMCGPPLSTWALKGHKIVVLSRGESISSTGCNGLISQVHPHKIWAYSNATYRAIGLGLGTCARACPLRLARSSTRSASSSGSARCWRPGPRPRRCRWSRLWRRGRPAPPHLPAPAVAALAVAHTHRAEPRKGHRHKAKSQLDE